MNKRFVMRFPNGLKKALTFSFDDGVEQDKWLVEVLDKYGMKGTFNLNGGRFAAEDKVYAEGTIHRRMKKSACVELFKNGNHEVAVHAYSHPWLEKLPAPQVAYEIIKDREVLEETFGCIIRGMAYPYGTYSDEVVRVLETCGVVYSRTTKQTEKFDMPTDWLRLPSTCHYKNAKLMELAENFVSLNVTESPKLFYVWGHTYEFEQYNNWDVFENFAEYISGRDDIWYATNIDIYEYVEDYNRLLFSADMHIVKNPTGRTLWFEVGNNVYSIGAGETLSF